MRSLRHTNPASRAPSIFSRRVTVFILGSILCSPAGWARQGPPPPSQTNRVGSLSTVTVLETPPVDRTRLLAEDAAAKGAGPLRFAEVWTTQVSPATDGAWEALPDGGRLWRLRVYAPGATDLNFGFTRYRLPKGARLYLISEDHGYYQGPYTDPDARGRGELWTPVVPGDRAVIELYLPAETKEEPDLWLTRIGRGYRDFFQLDGAGIQAGSCNIDVRCPAGLPWTNEIRSVARYTYSANYLCTGTLIMDASASFRNFFLTANHCALDAVNAASLVVYWNFESPTCGQHGGGSLAQNQLGSTFRAAKTDVDFSLVELDEDPDPAFNVFYSGWDRSGVAPTGTVTIHHPNGDEKSISFNTDLVTTVNSCIGSGGANTHWHVDDYESGTTEPGSSGSGLWAAGSHRLIGALSGGTASCSATNDPDCYGKFSVAWDSGSSSADRLKDWLDPSNTGALSVPGANAPPVLPPPILLYPTGGQTNYTLSNLAITWRTNGAPPPAQAALEYTEQCAGNLPFFADSMESGTNGWTVSHASGSQDWRQITNVSHSATHSWFGTNVVTLSDKYLVSPAVLLSTNEVLSFWHRFNLEDTFDGGVVEISTNQLLGPWADLGTNFTQAGYTKVISTSYSSPIAGRQAFSGASGGFVQSLADLAPWSGRTVRLRFRLATDSSVGLNGWWVDDVTFAHAQTWKLIGTAPPAATNFAWITPNAPGTDYCVRLKFSAAGFLDSAWTQGQAFSLISSSNGLSLRKTVYAGHDGGASGAGASLLIGSNGLPITYFFEIGNVGNGSLTNVQLLDPMLGLSNSLGTLAAGHSLTQFVESVLGEGLINTARVAGTPAVGPVVMAESTAQVVRVITADSIWINEMHYDNIGVDANEGVEVAGRAGLDLSRFSLVFYDSESASRSYYTNALSGFIDDEGCGFGAVWFGLPTGIFQDGKEDGVALVKDGALVVQFLSYEGVLTATGGPAHGLLSTDIGVEETSSTPLEYALSLVGQGNRYVDFAWTGPTNASRGQLNPGQIFFPCEGPGDQDGDGLGDAWEFLYFGNLTTVTNSSDYDGDGFIDLYEFLAGSIPTNGGSYLRATTTSLAPSDGVVVVWTSESNKSYRLSRTADLLEDFSGLASNLPATPPLNSYTDPVSTNAGSFYRIQLQ